MAKRKDSLFDEPRAPLSPPAAGHVLLQPKDLISTMPRMHETNPFWRRNPPSPISPTGSYNPGSERERSATEASLASDTTSIQSDSSITSNTPPASSGAKFWKRRKKRGSETPSIEQITRSTSETRQDHYVPLESAAKCADKGCRRRFKFGDRKRNCAMCGEVFCRKCTKFLRKLSINAEPDPLGTFHNVCDVCFNVSLSSGRYRDLKFDYQQLRNAAKSAREWKSAMRVAPVTPLSAQPSSKSKSDRIREEIHRLVTGYKNHNPLKSMLATPGWQRSNNWMPDSKATQCFNETCKKKLHLGMRKVNCRVCGQVFCRECTKQEILLYCLSRDSPANWAINGKEGGPTSQPHRFETYPVCTSCCRELEKIMVTKIDAAPAVRSPSATAGVDNPRVSVMDEIAALQSELANMQRSIEHNLPIYKRLTDTLNIEDSSPRSVQGDHPLRNLAKSQADLSDTFTHLANRSQALKNLSPLTPTQERLLKHIMMGTFNFYQEYLYLFRSAQVKLREMVPIESLSLIQEYLDQQSLERVHLALRQLTYEVLNVEKIHKCPLEFAENLVTADMAISGELCPVLEKKGESWETHLECLGDLVQENFQKRPFIKLELQQQGKKNGSKNEKLYVRYFVLDRTKHVLSRCVHELDAKTREEAFLETKSSLAKTGKHVSSQLKIITDRLTGP